MVKDVSSLGMHLVAPSLPDVILCDWGRSSRDCFWGAGTLSFCFSLGMNNINAMKYSHMISVSPDQH